ncbi:phospholipase/carboxylesterase [Flammeovirgaceae bacterium 311]|nr:phospholipase/carboxylesterase [Flammeovirgaceae bacterium 311]
MYTHNAKPLLALGSPLQETNKALILIHGRGASARDILSLGQALEVEDFTLFAPEATNNSWYPYSFMAPTSQNQPALDSALQLLDSTVHEIMAQGVTGSNIYIAGFSQGACLALEYTTRHAQRWGGIAAFTGGLIGKSLDHENYKGSFEQTPVFISTGDPDPHVPLSRVEETKKIMESMGAQLSLKVFRGRPHTILQEEVDLANRLIFNPK